MYFVYSSSSVVNEISDKVNRLIFLCKNHYLCKIWKSYTKNIIRTFSLSCHLHIPSLFLFLFSLFQSSTDKHFTSNSCYILCISVHIGSTHRIGSSNTISKYFVSKSNACGFNILSILIPWLLLTLSMYNEN